MDDQSIITTKLRYIESKVKLKLGEIIDNPRTKLVAAANEHALVLVGCQTRRSLWAISTDKLLGLDKSASTNHIEAASELIFELPLSFRPTLVTVARGGFSPLALVFGDSDDGPSPRVALIDIGSASVCYELNLKELTNQSIVDHSWHPNHASPLIAICSSNGTLAALTISIPDRRLSLVYAHSQYGCLSCSWSPKGKNLAIGMSSGRIMRLELSMSATSFALKDVDNSLITLNHNKISPQHQVMRLKWINRYFLLSAHSRPGECPDTLYSLITLKPSKPFRHWSNVVFENQQSGLYSVYMVNLLGAVVCCSSRSSEAATIGVDGAKEAANTELNDWHNLLIDEEGARVELPLDSDNRETYARGATVAYHKSCGVNEPILVIYTNAGMVCTYRVQHCENIMKLPDCPAALSQPNPVAVQNARLTASQRVQQPESIAKSPDRAPVSSAPIPAVDPNASLVSAQRIQQPESIVKPLERSVVLTKPLPVGHIANLLKSVKEATEFNDIFLGLLEEVFHSRRDITELQDHLNLLRDAIEVFKEENDSLDLGMLENLHLIEHVKARAIGHRRLSLDPIMARKVDKIKMKGKMIFDRIKDLDVIVEDHLRQRSKNSSTVRLSSPELVYHTLATNQKIIRVLKKKLVEENKTSETIVECNRSLEQPRHIKFEVNTPKMRAFKAFLVSRCTVPIRQPVQGVSR